MPFPVIMIILIIAGLFGGVMQSGTNTQPTDESQIIISTPSGGLIRSGSGVQDREDTRPTPPSQPSTPTTPAPVVPTPPEPRELPPILTTWGAQNIETTRVLLRGDLQYPEAEYGGRLFFMYSTNESAVRASAPTTNQVVVSNNVRRSGQYSVNLSGLNDDTTYYYRLCFEAAIIQCGNTLSFTTVEDMSRSSYYREPSVSNRVVEDIESESAILSATYSLNDGELVTAFLVYGESSTAVREVEREYDTYDEVREQGDNLQKIRVSSRLNSSGELTRELDDLERDTEYHFSFCIAYDDDIARGISCGYTRSFETRERDYDEPSIGFVEVNVAGTLVEMTATVDMRDYLDGHVFAVYGSDESRVEAVQEASRFSSIRQSTNTLQKISIDTDFDGRDRVFASARDLLPGTQYYRFCVEYEEENRYGYETEVLTCSPVQSFTAR